MNIQITKGSKTALLFGATGMVGTHCLDALLASEIYEKVIIFARRKIKNDNPKLIQYVLNFDDLEKRKELIQGDDLFCALGTTLKNAGNKAAFRKVDFEYVTKIGQLAQDNQVNQFLLVSAVGADEDSLFFYNQIKGEVENALKELSFWAIHIFRPSILLGERKEFRLGERIAARLTKGLDFFLGDLLDKYKPVSGQVVANAMLQAAQGVNGGIFYYASHQLQDLADKTDLVKPKN